MPVTTIVSRNLARLRTARLGLAKYLKKPSLLSRMRASKPGLTKLIKVAKARSRRAAIFRKLKRHA